MSLHECFPFIIMSDVDVVEMRPVMRPYCTILNNNVGYNESTNSGQGQSQAYHNNGDI
ncbi:MAG: hypothetical protein NVS4B11_32290 [Ktedonobacteraceae bacterium]